MFGATSEPNTPLSASAAILLSCAFNLMVLSPISNGLFAGIFNSTSPSCQAETFFIQPVSRDITSDITSNHLTSFFQAFFAFFVKFGPRDEQHLYLRDCLQGRDVVAAKESEETHENALMACAPFLTYATPTQLLFLNQY